MTATSIAGGQRLMKSRSRCFAVLCLIMNSSRATAQPASACDQFDASIESTADSRDAVGPRRAPVGFARAASVDSRDFRTIAGYSSSRKETAAARIDEFAPGVTGGVIGAIVGGALGFLRVQAYCDNGVNCPVAPSVFTGAAIAAIIGLFVEWVVRSGPKPA